MIDISSVRELNRLDRIAITEYARCRLTERGITAYFPDARIWESDYKTRRERSE